MLYAAVFLVMGLSAGNIFSSVAFPPALPEPGTKVDEFFSARIRKELGKLPLVTELRARRGEWLECDAYPALDVADAAQSMTAALLQGSRAIAVQRIFWNRAERRLIGVVFLGGAMAGWPGVLHGGASATILQENLDRVAEGPEPGRMGQPGYVLQDFTINYRKPAYANRLYVVRAEIDGEAGGSVIGSRVRVRATFEKASDGLVLSEAHGTCSMSSDVSSKKTKIP